MRTAVGFAQALDADMGIDLRAAERAVPQQFLHRANADPFVEQGGSEAVAQKVGMKRLFEPRCAPQLR